MPDDARTPGRRGRRQALHPEQPTPRDVILQRAAGQIDTAEMLQTLCAMPMTAKVPGPRSGTDGAASMTGTARQLMAAFHQGLLTEQEYEAVRSARK